MSAVRCVEIAGGDITVDAGLLGEMLAVAPAEVPALMRARAITSLCERGIEANDGEMRLSFFYRNRRVRLDIDRSGRILRRSTVDFGAPSSGPAPAARLRRSLR
jgi:hypothetical protein